MMGCVLQPGDVIAVAALQPGQTTSDAVQPSQEIDICAMPVLDVVTLNNVSRFFQTNEKGPGFSDSSLGWELQDGSNSVIIENEDNGGGPPNFFTQFFPSNWVEPKPPAGAYHARWNQTGGGGAADGSSTAQNVWVPITGGGLIFVITEANFGTYQIIANVEISDDAGATTLVSATVDLTLDLTP